MIHVKHQKITVLSTVQKLENVMHVHIKSHFLNILQKNTMQLVKLKRGNILIVKIYPLNALLIVSLFHFINNKILINNFTLLCSNIIICSTGFSKTKMRNRRIHSKFFIRSISHYPLLSSILLQTQPY